MKFLRLFHYSSERNPRLRDRPRAGQVPRRRPKVPGHAPGHAPFSVKTNRFERFGKIPKNKVVSKPCVLSVKVGLKALGPTRERRDPHDPRSLCTKVRGTNLARLTGDRKLRIFEGRVVNFFESGNIALCFPDFQYSSKRNDRF